MSNEVPPEAVTTDAEEPEEPEEPDSALESEAPISDDMAATEDQNSYAAKKFDMEGQLLQEINLNDVAVEQEWFYCQGVAQDGNGNLYIVVNDGKILCYNADGKRHEDIDLGTYYVQSLVTAGSGTVLATYFDSDGDGGTVFSRLENGAPPSLCGLRV